MNRLTRLQLIRQLRRHIRLSERRSAIWQQNKSAKWALGVMAVLTVLYLMFFAVMFALVVNSTPSVSGTEFMFGISPFILTLDFVLRFIAQQTPSQLIKPYVLLPIPKYACIESFQVTSMLSWGNLIWYAMLLPFSIMSILFSEGIWVTLAFLFAFYVLIITNSQWYQLVRSLISTKIWWWLLPIAVYAVVALPFYVGSNPGLDSFCNFYSALGSHLMHCNPLAWLALFVALANVLYVNRHVQYKLIWRELGKVQQTKIKHISSFSSLDRLGHYGEYLKLEVKSIFRNKNLRTVFIFGTIIVLIFSLLVSFTDAYSGDFMSTFWCIYNFAIYGAMMLVRVMCYEGNYIDCLMVRRENILTLLRAKYYFFVTLLLFPFILMLPTIFTGRCSLLMVLSVMLFTAGAEYALFFQMAVYNKQTVPLNSKLVGRGTMENSYMQMLLEAVVFLVPILLIQLLRALFSDTAAYLVLLIIGVAFIIAHPLWLRNIYNRMMQRKYQNIEGFHQSRV